MTPLLEFAIPTWKRPDTLHTSVCSIADQGLPVVISHHLCDTETLPVVEELKKKYPELVRAVACEIGSTPDYADSFRQLFHICEAKYTWTFGDDDVLLPDALKFIGPLLERDEFDFIHVAEVVRTPSSGTLIKGSLHDLCNIVGWIDMTGFISCNIIRTDYLNAAASLPSWELYAKNAFVHSCALLEVLHDKKAAFYDLSFVDSKVLENPDKTSARWNETNTSLRYHYVDDALMDMCRRGILKENLQPKFFRYLNNHLWDRFAVNIIHSYMTDQSMVFTPYIQNLMDRCANIMTLLNKSDRRRFLEELSEIRCALIDHAGAIEYAINKVKRLIPMWNSLCASKYGVVYND